MSVTTKYTCDKCKHTREVPGTCAEGRSERNRDGADARDFYDLSFNLKWANSPRHALSHPHNINTATWCRNCIVGAGITPPRHDEEKPLEPITLEDLVREIVQDEVSAATGI